MKDYKTVIFDLDGTLSDSKEGITKSVQYALSKMGIIEEDLTDLEHFVGPPMVEQYKISYGMSDEEAFKTLEYYRERYVPIGIYETSKYPGVVEILTKIKNSGRFIGLATSKPENMAIEVLKYLEIFDFFDEVSGADLHGPRQSKEAVLGKLFEKNPIFKKEEAIIVGDTKYDIEGANNIGIDGCGVTWGTGTREELENEGAKFVVDTPEELIEKLLGE